MKTYRGVFKFAFPSIARINRSTAVRDKAARVAQSTTFCVDLDPSFRVSRKPAISHSPTRIINTLKAGALVERIE